MQTTRFLIPPRRVAMATANWLDVDRMIWSLTKAGADAWLAAERSRRAEEQGIPVERVEMRGLGYRPQWDMHRQIAIAQRFCGLRVSQLLELRWDELNLDESFMLLRAGRQGAKLGRERIVPLHPTLRDLFRRLRGRAQDGRVFARKATKGARRGSWLKVPGSEVAKVFTGAWERAGVGRMKWAAEGGRERARPTHAIRAVPGRFD